MITHYLGGGVSRQMRLIVGKMRPYRAEEPGLESFPLDMCRVRESAKRLCVEQRVAELVPRPQEERPQIIQPSTIAACCAGEAASMTL